MISVNFACACTLWLVLAGSTLCAASAPAWGEPVNGIRLGLKTKDVPGTYAIEILFRNVSETEQVLVIGATTGIGPIYSLDFVATRPDGNTCKVLDVTVGSVGGVLLPIVLRLGPGEIRNVSIATESLICVADRKYLTADVLLENGYSIQASFVGHSDTNISGEMLRGWLGTVKSGSLRTSRQTGEKRH